MQKIFNRHYLLAVIVLMLILITRVATLEVADLTDPTESRYAVAGQEMLLKNNWLTPKFYQEGNLVPYLGKPPLHFWLVASAYKIFGMDEWTARLPSFLSLLVTCLFLWKLVSVVYNKSTAINALLILSSSALMFFFAGACVVDVSLTASITAAISSFVLFLKCQNKNEKLFWAGLFFIALAVGFLIKGPVALALSLLPLLVWLKINNSLKEIYALPWIFGTIIFFSILLPWFILQEISNPGFIKYFFVNENFLRFLIKNYGDKYGTGHKYFQGSSWWMLWVAFLPWSLILSFKLPYLRNKRARAFLKTQFFNIDGLFLIWGLVPAVFFTFVKQLHPAYLLPALPGLAVYTSVLIKRMGLITQLQKNISRRFSYLFYLILVLLLTTATIATTFHFSNINVSLLLFILILLYFGCKQFKLLSHKSTAHIIYISAYAVMLYCSLTSASADLMNADKSTEDIMRYVADNSKDEKVQLAILQTKSQSPYFYANAWETELSKEIDVHYASVDTLKNFQFNDLIVRVKELKKMPVSLLSSYNVKMQLGKWIWYQKKLPI